MYSLNKKDDYLIVSFPPNTRLSGRKADKIREKLKETIFNKEVLDVVLNLGNIEFIDSHGVTTIMLLYKFLLDKRGSLQLCCSSPSLLNFFHMIRFDTMIPIYEDLQAVFSAHHKRDLVIEKKGINVSIIKIPSKVFNYNEAMQFKRRFHEVFTRDKTEYLIIDMASVTFVDSYALGILAALGKQMSIGRIKLVVTCQEIKEIMKLVMFQDIFTMHPSIDKAIESFNNEN